MTESAFALATCSGACWYFANEIELAPNVPIVQLVAVIAFAFAAGVHMTELSRKWWSR